LFTKLLHFLPGIGTVGAVGINIFLNGFYTYRLGKAVANQFENQKFTTEEFLNSANTLLPLLLPMPGPQEIKEVMEVIVG
jgi:hypothetical protein